jgi:hypothetical protein
MKTFVEWFFTLKTSANSRPLPMQKAGLNSVLIFVISAVVLLVALPLTISLVPPMVDLPEHVMMGKYFRDALAGNSSASSLEIDWYLGYRLLSLSLASLFGIFNFFGLSYRYIPQITSILIIAFFAGVFAWITLKQTLSNLETVESLDKRRIDPLKILMLIPLLAFGASLAYTSSFYWGFGSWMVSLPFVTLYCFSLEKVLENRLRSEIVKHVVWLYLSYVAHPLSILFCAQWAIARIFVSLFSREFDRGKLKAFLTAACIAIPMVVYHGLTIGNEEPLHRRLLQIGNPIISVETWSTKRLPIFSTTTHVSGFALPFVPTYTLCYVGLITLGLALLFLRRNPRGKKTLLTWLVFAFFGSWLNEASLPLPQGLWADYGGRFASVAYMLGAFAFLGLIIPALLISDLTAKNKTIFVSLVLFISLSGFVDRFYWLVAENQTMKLAHESYFLKQETGPQKTFIRVYNERFPFENHLKKYVCLFRPCQIEHFNFGAVPSRLYPIRKKSPNSQDQKPWKCPMFR